MCVKVENLPFYSVDVSSVDRRSIEKKQESSKKVDDIINKFRKSQLQEDLHIHVIHSMVYVRKEKLQLYKPRQPNAFRILVKLIRYYCIV